MFAHFPKSKGSVAAVCFNVKGPDLCFLDQPVELDESDRAMYEALGVPCAPFQNVRYFAPFKVDNVSLNTLRSNEELLGNVQPLTWASGRCSSSPRCCSTATMWMRRRMR